MTLRITQFFIIIGLLTLAQLSKADSIILLQSNNLSNHNSVTKFVNDIQQNYPREAKEATPSITLSVGVEAIESAIKINQNINLATALSESEILQLTRKYPVKLKNTVFVLSQPGFRCQMDLFKKNSANSNKSLGILLKNETLKLYPFIKKYAEQISINVTTWQIQLNESLSDGLHHLMEQQDVLLLLALVEFNQSPQLNVIVQEAKILNKELIASSEHQIEKGISTGCIIKDDDWLAAVINIIEKIKHKKNIKSNYQLSKQQADFKILMPSITILD